MVAPQETAVRHIGTRAAAPRVLPMQLVGHSDGCPGRVLEYGPDAITAVFMVPADSSIFVGHYPHHPLLPGVFLVEAALQAIEFARRTESVQMQRLVQVKNLQLLRAIDPGQWITVEAQRIDSDTTSGSTLWRATLKCDSSRVASCTLGFADPAVESTDHEEGPLPALPDGFALSPAHIVSALAHRPPILMVDGAFRSFDGQQIRARKLVSLNEPCFGETTGIEHMDTLHFPQTLVLESLVQSAGLLMIDPAASVPYARRPLMIFGGIGDCRFIGDASPGEMLEHDIRLTRQLGDSAILNGRSWSNGRLVLQVTRLIVALKDPGGLTSRTPREDDRS